MMSSNTELDETKWCPKASQCHSLTVICPIVQYLVCILYSDEFRMLGDT